MIKNPSQIKGNAVALWHSDAKYKLVDSGGVVLSEVDDLSGSLNTKTSSIQTQINSEVASRKAGDLALSLNQEAFGIFAQDTENVPEILTDCHNMFEVVSYKKNLADKVYAKLKISEEYEDLYEFASPVLVSFSIFEDNSSETSSIIVTPTEQQASEISLEFDVDDSVYLDFKYCITAKTALSSV